MSKSHHIKLKAFCSQSHSIPWTWPGVVRKSSVQVGRALSPLAVKMPSDGTCSYLHAARDSSQTSSPETLGNIPLSTNVTIKLEEAMQEEGLNFRSDEGGWMDTTRVTLSCLSLGDVSRRFIRWRADVPRALGGCDSSMVNVTLR